MTDIRKTTIGEVTHNFDSQRVPLSAKQRTLLEKKYRYYGAQGVIDYVDNYLFNGEFLLIAEDGENLKSQNSNICNIVNGKFWVNNHAHILQASLGNNNLYLYYLLNQVNFRNYVTGSAQPKLTKDSLESIPIYVHDSNYQEKIADVLSSIDQKIEINNRISAELEAMAKTLYDYWFVQFDFPDENGKPYKSSGGKMVYSKELKREIPAGWEAGTLFDLGEIVGGSTPSRENSENFTTHGTAWITPKDLSNNKRNAFISKGETDVTNDGIKNASLKILPKHTILLSSRAPIGYMAIATNELTTNQGFKSFVSNKDYPFSFIFHTVQSKLKTIEQYASGSTFKEISASTLKTVVIPLPSIELVSLFHGKVLPAFEQRETLEKENQQLAALRDWLLPMLMNGQVQVTENQQTLKTTEIPYSTDNSRA